jgi:hypothetical protein
MEKAFIIDIISGGFIINGVFIYKKMKVLISKIYQNDITL